MLKDNCWHVPSYTDGSKGLFDLLLALKISSENRPANKSTNY